MITAITSLLTGLKVDPTIAMTGEITLRGAVLPVGGVKEKVLAAHRAGIRTVILPDKVRKDLVEVPDEIKEALEFRFVSRMEEVLELALGQEGLSEVRRRHGAAKAAGGRRRSGCEPSSFGLTANLPSRTRAP